MTTFARTFAATALCIALSAIGNPAQAQISAPAMQEIQDRLMIEDLMARYEWALDTGDADAYGALFAEDGVLTSGGTRETKGREAIAKEVRDLSARFRAAEKPNADGTPARARKVIHSYSNVIIEVKGKEATAKSNWVEVWNIRGPLEVGGAGEYHDKLVKQNGKWQFIRREIRSTMTAARPAAAATPAPAPAPRP